MTTSERRNVVAFLEFFTVFGEFLTVMVLTFVLSQCFIVKLLTKPILFTYLNMTAKLNLFIHLSYDFVCSPPSGSSL